MRYLEYLHTDRVEEWLPRAWGEKRMGNYCLMVREIQFEKMKKLCRWMNGGDGCTSECT